MAATLTRQDASEVLPMVAIVGRPNVGKSTFFNKMIGKRRALVQNRPGVTRDRQYGESDYIGRRFSLIDTGGFEPEAAKDDVFQQVRTQATLAIEEADVVMLFFDGRQGVASGDYELVEMMRESGKPTLYVVNKVDGPPQEQAAYEFYQLGVEKLFFISSELSRGVDDMLDELLNLLPPEPPPQVAESESDLEAFEPEVEEEEEAEEGSRHRRGWREDPDAPVRIALVGRPNVGKSSLINQMLGYERQVVHPVAGTTRDAVDVPFELDGRRYVLVDTAGVRRKSRISDKLEQFTVIKAFKAITGADVCLLMVDAVEGVTAQEQRLGGLIEEKGRGVAILVNKWDLLEAQGADKQKYAEKVMSQLDHIRYAPVHFLSAKTGAGVRGIMPLVGHIGLELRREIGTADLNAFLESAVVSHPPPMYKGGPVRLLYISQVKRNPPTFLIFVNHPEGVRADYRRYLENRMRDKLGFIGAPIHFVIRERRR